MLGTKGGKTNAERGGAWNGERFYMYWRAAEGGSVEILQDLGGVLGMSPVMPLDFLLGGGFALLCQLGHLAMIELQTKSHLLPEGLLLEGSVLALAAGHSEAGEWLGRLAKAGLAVEPLLGWVSRSPNATAEGMAEVAALVRPLGPTPAQLVRALNSFFGGSGKREEWQAQRYDNERPRADEGPSAKEAFVTFVLDLALLPSAKQAEKIMHGLFCRTDGLPLSELAVPLRLARAAGLSRRELFANAGLGAAVKRWFVSKRGLGQCGDLETAARFVEHFALEAADFQSEDEETGLSEFELMGMRRGYAAMRKPAFEGYRYENPTDLVTWQRKPVAGDVLLWKYLLFGEEED